MKVDPSGRAEVGDYVINGALTGVGLVSAFWTFLKLGLPAVSWGPQAIAFCAVAAIAAVGDLVSTGIAVAEIVHDAGAKFIRDQDREALRISGIVIGVASAAIGGAAISAKNHYRGLREGIPEIDSPPGSPIESRVGTPVQSRRTSVDATLNIDDETKKLDDILRGEGLPSKGGSPTARTDVSDAEDALGGVRGQQELPVGGKAAKHQPALEANPFDDVPADDAYANFITRNRPRQMLILDAERDGTKLFKSLLDDLETPSFRHTSDEMWNAHDFTKIRAGLAQHRIAASTVRQIDVIDSITTDIDFMQAARFSDVM
jgi:hypothetical protein